MTNETDQELDEQEQDGDDTTAIAAQIETGRFTVPPLPLAEFDDYFKDSINVREYTGDADVIDKDELIGERMLIAAYKFNENESGREYVSVWVTTAKGRSGLFNDGGTGIMPILKRIDAEGKGPMHGGMPIAVSKGLRVSRYSYNGAPAETYYFN